MVQQDNSASQQAQRPQGHGRRRFTKEIERMIRERTAEIAAADASLNELISEKQELAELLDQNIAIGGSEAKRKELEAGIRRIDSDLASLPALISQLNAKLVFYDKMKQRFGSEYPTHPNMYSSFFSGRRIALTQALYYARLGDRVNLESALKSAISESQKVALTVPQKFIDKLYRIQQTHSPLHDHVDKGLAAADRRISTLYRWGIAGVVSAALIGAAGLGIGIYALTLGGKPMPVPPISATSTPAPTPTLAAIVATATPTPSAIATPVPTAEPTSTPTPSATATPAPTATPKAYATQTPVPTAISTPQPTSTPYATPTPTPGSTATPIPTVPARTPTPKPTPQGLEIIVNAQRLDFSYSAMKGFIQTTGFYDGLVMPADNVAQAAIRKNVAGYFDGNSSNNEAPSVGVAARLDTLAKGGPKLRIYGQRTSSMTLDVNLNKFKTNLAAYLTAAGTSDITPVK